MGKQRNKSGNAATIRDSHLKLTVDSEHPIAVQLPPATGLTKWKPLMDLVTVIILFASLIILGVSTHLSWIQFRYARERADAAEQALDKSQRAEQLSIAAQKRIEAYEFLIKELHAELTKTKDLTQLSYLTLRAESGDRAALIALKEISTDNNWMLTTVAEKNLNRIWVRFNGMEISDPGVSARINGLHMMTDKDAVERFLGSPQYETRAEAVDTVRFLRLNALIPRVIDIGLSDPDLHVIQVVCNTLNTLLLEPDAKWQFQEHGGSAYQPLSIYDFVIASNRTDQTLRSVWEARKERFLAMKPKYWKPIDGGKLVLVDPEVDAGKISDRVEK